MNQFFVIILKFNFTKFLTTEMCQNQIGCFNVNCMQSLLNLEQFHIIFNILSQNSEMNLESQILNWPSPQNVNTNLQVSGALQTQ